MSVDARSAARQDPWQRLIGHAGAALALGADRLVLLRLGHLEGFPPRAGPPAEVDSANFWEASTIATPRRLDEVHAPRRRGPAGALRARWHAAPAVSVVDLEGRSDGPGTHPGSGRVVARAYLRGDARAGAPLVILLHGYAALNPAYEEAHARRLLARGAHAARLDLPFHLRRRVPGRGSGEGFFSTDLGHTRDVLRQSVEDAAALVAWARRAVTPRVSVIGFSLGGLVALLLATRVPVDAVVAITPPVDLADTLVDRAPRRARRRAGLVGGSGGPWGADLAAARAFASRALAPVIPERLAPVTEPARVTLVGAGNDLFVGPDAVRRLGAAWGTDVWMYGQGHVTVMYARGLTRRVHDRVLATA